MDALFKCAAASGAFAAQAPSIVKELVNQLGVVPSKKIFRQLYEGVGLAHENDRNVSKTLARDIFGDSHAKRYEEELKMKSSSSGGAKSDVFDDEEEKAEKNNNSYHYDEGEFFDEDDDDDF